LKEHVHNLCNERKTERVKATNNKQNKTKQNNDNLSRQLLSTVQRIHA